MNTFNIIQFTKKVMIKFIKGSIYRFASSNHTFHVYPLKFIKILAQYGLLKIEEMDEIFDILVSKMHAFLQFEKIISEKQLSKYLYYNRLIRKYICEFMIQYLYAIMDDEFIQQLQTNVTVESDKTSVSGNFNFSKSRIYESDSQKSKVVYKKFLDVFIGFVLNDNKFDDGSIFLTKEISNLSDNFIPLFANIDDNYYKSI